MHDRTKRLTWTVLAVLLPGPWTPVIVLVYFLGHAAKRDQDGAHHHWASQRPPADPYAYAPDTHYKNPHTPTR